MTNVILTLNQQRKQCPENYSKVPSTTCRHQLNTKHKIRHESRRAAKCGKSCNNLKQKGNSNLVLSNRINPFIHNYKISNNICLKNRIKSHKSHGRETGYCVKGDRKNNDDVYACEIKSWCPVESDDLPTHDSPFIQGTDNFTVLIKNIISFPLFGSNKYLRNNMPNGFCRYNPDDESTWLCSIFRLGDIITMAGGKIIFTIASIMTTPQLSNIYTQETG